jgi:hypothetical protein
MKRSMFIWMWMILLVGTAFAGSPTIPTTITPENETVWFNDTITCSGSTDPDADDFNYLLWYNWNSTDAILLQNSSIISHDFFGFGALSSLEFSYTGDGTNSLSLGTSMGSPNVMTKSGGSGTSQLNTSFSYKFNADYLPILFWGDVGDKYIYIDGHIAYYTSSRVDNNVFFLNVTNFTDGEIHDVVINFNAESNEQARFWFEQYNATISCQAQDENNEFSDNLTYFYTLPILRPCNGGNVALNITLLNEEDHDERLEADWSIALGLLADSWGSFNSVIEEKNNFSICIIPDDVEISIKGLVEYTPTSVDYSFPRQYYFNGADIIGNNPMLIDMFALGDDLSSAVVFTVVENGVVVNDALIKVQRWNPGTGIYSLVAMGETDTNGQDTIYLRLTDAFYRILVVVDGSTVYSSDPGHISDEEVLIDLTSSDEYLTDWSSWYEFQSIVYNISFNATTNNTILTADDTSGASTSMCLRVQRIDLAEPGEVCYTCESSSSVTIYCELPDVIDATYSADFIAFKDSVWSVVGGQIFEFKSTIGDLIGEEGLVFSALIIIVLAFLGSQIGPVGFVIGGALGVAFSLWMGFLNVGLASGVAILIILGGIAFKIGKR